MKDPNINLNNCFYVFALKIRNDSTFSYHNFFLIFKNPSRCKEKHFLIRHNRWKFFFIKDSVIPFIQFLEISLLFRRLHNLLINLLNHFTFTNGHRVGISTYSDITWKAIATKTFNFLFFRNLQKLNVLFR